MKVDLKKKKVNQTKTARKKNIITLKKPKHLVKASKSKETKKEKKIKKEKSKS